MAAIVSIMMIIKESVNSRFQNTTWTKSKSLAFLPYVGLWLPSLIDKLDPLIYVFITYIWN